MEVTEKKLFIFLNMKHIQMTNQKLSEKKHIMLVVAFAICPVEFLLVKTRSQIYF